MWWSNSSMVNLSASNPFTILYVRGLVFVLVSYPVLIRFFPDIKIIKDNDIIDILAWRSIVGTVYIALQFISVQNLEVYLVTILSNTAPFVTMVLSSAIFDEKITRWRVGTIISVVLGVVLVSFSDLRKATQGVSGSCLGYIILLFAVLSGSVVKVLVRKRKVISADT